MTGTETENIKIGDSGMYIRCESVGDTEWTKKIDDINSSDMTNNGILDQLTSGGESAIVGHSILGLVFLLITYSVGQYIFRDIPNQIIKEKIYNSNI